jgi:sarcosine oxidase subunit alpha
MRAVSDAATAQKALYIRVDGEELRVMPGSSVAAALENAGIALRRSVHGYPRGAVCGMGICHECRVSIDGVQQQRACMVDVADGMDVSTHG